MPWRGSNDPYSIWVSEVMLQQTTVGAVRGRYESFLARFPDVHSLAAAPRDDVLAEWSGLGYYARARNLHAAAEIVAREHGGRVPSDPAVLRRLPGFGEYMSAAVASLAYGVRAPAADANVERVVSRLFAIDGVAGSRAHRALVLEAAERLLPHDRPGDLIAAFMDLGQTICTPRSPACGICPLLSDCAAVARGDPARYPKKSPRPPVVRIAYAAADARRRGRILMVRRPAGLLGGLWELPSAEGATPAAARLALSRRLRALGLRLDLSAPRHFVSHTIVRRRLEVEILPAIPAREAAAKSAAGPETKWFRPDELESAAIPTLTRKIARAGGFLPPKL
ncbi:MAG TPA: A/G-specific adenine glycosylase [Thermoanaerobaculia bacterium]